MIRLLSRFAAIGLALALGACTTADVLDPPALVGNAAPVTETDSDVRNSLAAETSPPAAGMATFDPVVPQGDGNQAAASQGPVRLQFAPVMGAEADELSPLTQRILQRSAERGLAVTMAADPNATHVVKGYFSTLKETGGNTLVYVWDVFDRAGTRVHRIQGKEAALGQGAGVALRAVADRTVDDLANWLNGARG